MINDIKCHDLKCIGNVIRIIDRRTIIVNAGKRALSVGQNIQVYELGDEIKDLDGRVLSQFIHVKDTLEVIQAEENYSVCKKMKTVTKTISPLALSPLLETKKTEYIPLHVDEADIQELKPTDPFVRVGDPIKLV